MKILTSERRGQTVRNDTNIYFCALILLLFAFAVQADDLPTPRIKQTGDCSYSLTLTTTASTDTIWALWEDVENWKDYDTILKYSYLLDDAKFEVGAVGYVKAKGAPKTKFELIAVQTNKSFTESLKLPFWNTLLLKRLVDKDNNGQAFFTHEVEFKGPLKGLMYFFLAKTFKEELPLVMGRLKALAEKKEAASSAESVEM